MDNSPKKDLSKYKNSFFFFDADDEDLIVPMRNPKFGYTLNFAKPLAYIFLLIVLLVLILITRLLA
ncbi:hypothetical protein A5893_14660 [Pedobacter psychrophilus]|uniref:DUF5808 domain-containing protein n=2 Tax=Pedobacter psychrophilus TaxID=1826909 RepID=A0A179DCK1_9SPHI|nr:hypothetical protein A5893_14660 [Pedobacter psychrophilus]